jgi:hypothetical protein
MPIELIASEGEDGGVERKFSSASYFGTRITRHYSQLEPSQDDPGGGTRVVLFIATSSLVSLNSSPEMESRASSSRVQYYP